jgi:hypothetical protein
MVAIALLDHLQYHGGSCVVIETDDGNPDVGKIGMKAGVPVLAANLDGSDGWIEMVNTIESTDADKSVIVNGAARSGTGVSAYGNILAGSLEALARPLVTLFVINRQRDSLELLADYLEAMPPSQHHQVHVVRNGYFGDDGKYQLYDGSTLRTQIEAAGGKSLTFPDLADRVADRIYSDRMTIAEAAAALPIGDRAELMRWRQQAHAMLAEVTRA